MQSTTIITFGKTDQEICSVHNTDFERASEIFKMFDDFEIINSKNKIIELDQDFEFRFYLNNIVECNFDVFMMACFSGYIPLIESLFEQNKHKINTEYQFGTCEYTTPLAIIYDFYNHNEDKYNSCYEQFKPYGDFNKLDVFGGLLIPV